MFETNRDLISPITALCTSSDAECPLYFKRKLRKIHQIHLYSIDEIARGSRRKAPSTRDF